MEQHKERVAAVFGGLEPGMASKAPAGSEKTSEHDKERISHRHDDQHVCVPPAKRTRSDDHRGQRSREHDEHRPRSRGRYRRRGEGGRHRSRREMDPDYVKNPSKWTKYELKDDGSEVLRGMSQDQVNKYAAFQFLDEVKKRKMSTRLQQDSEDSITDDSTDSVAKVVFKKPLKNPDRFGKQANSTEDGAMVDIAQSSRADSEGGIKTAEYVVGSKTAAQLHKERRQKKAKLVSLHSEEEESDTAGGSESNREATATSLVVTKSRENKSKSSGVKCTKSVATICLSHLEDEEEEDT